VLDGVGVGDGGGVKQEPLSTIVNSHSLNGSVQEHTSVAVFPGREKNCD